MFGFLKKRKITLTKDIVEDIKNLPKEEEAYITSILDIITPEYLENKAVKTMDFYYTFISDSIVYFIKVKKDICIFEWKIPSSYTTLKELGETNKDEKEG